MRQTQLMCREVFKELSEAPGAEPSLRKHLHCGIALHIGYWPLVLGLCSLLRLLFFLEKLDFMLLFELPLHLILELSPCKIGESLLCIWGLPGGSDMVKNLSAMWETWVQSLVLEDPLERGMATHSSILTWRIPWTEESGELQFMGLQSVGHDRVTNTHHTLYTQTHTHTHTQLSASDCSWLHHELWWPICQHWPLLCWLRTPSPARSSAFIVCTRPGNEAYCSQGANRFPLL